MSRKSSNRKNQIREELEKVPDESIAGLIKTTAPDLARKLDPKAIRLLGSQAVTEITHHSVTATMWGGPLPPPEQLEQYDKAFPGAAERIIAMAEKQAQHRQSLEASVIPDQQRQSSNGQKFAFVIALAGITGATLTGIFGSTWAAVAIAAGAMGVLTVSFVFGKNSQKQQLSSKTSTASRTPVTE
jgi:uncharacterized membrane protein